MRFVRITVSLSRAGQVVSVADSEVPLAEGVGSVIVGEECETRDLGVVEDQAWADEAGNPCTLGEHVLHRMRKGKDPQIVSVVECPCTHAGIKERLRARGPSAIPERVAHWLEFMGVFTPDDMEAAALPRLTLTRALEFDAMRKARDPSVGSRADYFKAEARRRIAERA